MGAINNAFNQAAGAVAGAALAIKHAKETDFSKMNSAENSALVARNQSRAASAEANEAYYEATEKGKSEGFNVSPERNFLFSLQTSEQLYFSLLKNGWKPEQARNVLPLALKTELYTCGFAEDWKHFFSLRASKAGAKGMHPQASELANMIYDKFVEAKLI